MKSILFGNGINIQYGGIDKYSNSAIIKRTIENIKSGKYNSIFAPMTIDELLGFINDTADFVRNIGKLEKYCDGLFMRMEIDRIKKSYTSTTPIENIGFEDLFIVLDLISNKYNDDDFARDEAKRGLRMLFLDSIYNNGEVNNVNYGDGLKKVLSHYDNVFTLNYDLNLERYCDTVSHLHGQFDVLAPEFDAESEFSKENPDKCRSGIVATGFEHMYSNSIMSWYWLDKYGNWVNKETVFGADKFQQMSGHLDIVGMSPCNDEHLFIMINKSALKSVTYYYKSDEDRTRMDKKVKKSITYTRVDKFWSKAKV